MPFKDLPGGQIHNYDLKYCRECSQMTNHLFETCQKCFIATFNLPKSNVSDSNTKTKKRLVPEGWTWQYRNSDIKGIIIEFICPHGVGHDKHVHGCDGCCGLLKKYPKPKK